MPELPEIESLRRILARSARGRTIVSAKIGRVALRRRAPQDFAHAIANRRIKRVRRRAKYLIIELSGGGAILVHLGMSGSLTHRREGFCGNDLDSRHDHIEFLLDDGSRLVFNDPRRFGIVHFTSLAEIDRIAELRHLGPEPLGRQFTLDYLVGAARGRTVAIKNLLMDQRILAGIGNIYAAEILFRAGVRPTRRAGRVTRAELERIFEFTPAVLRAAIGSGGTTFRSYRDSRGRPGRFARRLMVYGREGDPCYICSAPIRNVIVSQRASFYCPRCQH
jgi:formamidopyrimidine-DNA glycosylase